MNQRRMRQYVHDVLVKSEAVIYVILGLLLSVTSLLALVNASLPIWQGLRHGGIATQILQILNDLLVVLMLVEILHSVRISVWSHVLVTEPFLIVGLIASVRRILVITLQVAELTKGGAWTGETASVIFRDSMIELALLGGLVLVFVLSIGFLRRYAPMMSSEETPNMISPRNEGDEASAR